MRCLIKNIPPLAFGIAGNRGVGFPLVDYCSVLPQPIIEDTDCYLVKEEDGFTSILTEIENEIAVTCTVPEPDVCYIVLQENRNIWLGQQENREDLIFCSSFPSVPTLFLSKEEDITIAVLKEDDYEILLEF